MEEMEMSTPHEKMARMVARQVAESLPLKAEWFANAKTELGTQDVGAEESFRDECEDTIFEELVPIFAMTASAAPAAQPEEPQEDKLPPGARPIMETGCRRGYLHRKGFKCPLCGDTGQNVMQQNAAAG
jgi:hypothetical protein